MDPNNQVWWEVAQGRSNDARRWGQQEHMLKVVRSAEPKPGRNVIPAMGAVVVGILAAARKVIGALRPAGVEQPERARGKPKSYA